MLQVSTMNTIETSGDQVLGNARPEADNVHAVPFESRDLTDGDDDDSRERESCSEKLYNCLLTNPKMCDVLFLVGPEKVEIKYIKAVLVALSPEFKKQFQEKWGVAVKMNGENVGIPLPDYTPEAFKVFLKIFVLDDLTLTFLVKMKLPLDEMLNLISIGMRFGTDVTKAALTLLSKFIAENASYYLDTPDFLNLSLKSLKWIVSSESVSLDEIEIFTRILKWAKHQCSLRSLDNTPEGIRHVLGDCTHQIRFPLLSAKELSQIVFPANVLTVEERSEIFGLFVLDDEERNSVDATKCSFKLKKRFGQKRFETVTLFKASEIISDPAFTCDGTLQETLFQVDKKVELIGVGFLGPVTPDPSYYEIEVLVYHWNENTNEWDFRGDVKASIMTSQQDDFYVVFDKSIILNPKEGSESYNTAIDFKLKGPKTRSVVQNDTGSGKRIFTVVHDDITFECKWKCNQMVKLLYNKV